MKEYLDHASSPATAVPVVGTAALFNSFGDALPTLINVATFIYLVLLISHKCWQFYKGWKDRNESTE